MHHISAIAVVATSMIAAPAIAQSPREMLVSAAYGTQNRAHALRLIDSAIRGADAVLAADARDREARLQRAIAISYRGKLTRDRSDLVAARHAFEALAAAFPRDAEVQMALAGWHLGAVIELGPILARTALGARRAAGLEALSRAIALGRGRSLFPAFASLLHIQLAPQNVAASRSLADAAVAGRPATPIDRIMQRQARILLPALRPGNGRAAARLAKMLDPFGRLP